MISRISLSITLLGALATTAGLEAQLFQRQLGGNLDDRPNCVERTIDGGSIICGDQSLVVYT
ncbi:MAG: hypothetical protein KDC38_07115 [Planctomycetes bacterium]|nr:hypothetical protein [Planctomycetota bacterium]